MNNYIKPFFGQYIFIVLFFAILICTLNGCGGSGGGGDSGGNGGGTTPTYITWSKTYGEIYEDAAYSVQQTVDGGYIVAGNSDNKILVMKIDAYGNIVWQKILGDNKIYYAYCVQQTLDGGYIIAGQNIIGPISDFFIIKLYSDGNIEWQKEGTGGKRKLTFIKQTSDNGFIAAGDVLISGVANIWVLKIDFAGSEQWEKNYGGNEMDAAYSIQQTSDGGYIVAGETYSYGGGNSDFWIIKLNGNGEMLWQMTYGGSQYDIARSIRQTTDGGYVVVGETSSYGSGNSDIWVLKLDKDGNKEWDKVFGGAEVDVAYSVQQTSDGGYIIAGETSSYGAGRSDIWILKLDTNGNKIWDKTYGSLGNDVARSIQQTSDGGYIVAGETTTDAGDTDFWVLKLDANGNLN